VSARNHKAIFERKLPPDQWSGEKETWEVVCREWVSLEPLSGRELFQAQQVQSQTTHKSTGTYSPTFATVDSACRMKIENPIPVNQQDSNDDANYRIFEIESLVNVGEQNRELELMVVEKT
jgi:head-tail adaptor